MTLEQGRKTWRCVNCNHRFPLDGNKQGSNFQTLADWAPQSQVTVAVVFTDICGSTRYQEEKGDEEMHLVLKQHRLHARKLISQNKGCYCKDNGDEIIALFHNAALALAFVSAIYKNPKAGGLTIRAGLHVGLITIDRERNDISGKHVNYAKRVIQAMKKKSEVWVSNRAKEDLDSILSRSQLRKLNWAKRSRQIPGFGDDSHTLWVLG